jgi:hypothetical protein
MSNENVKMIRDDLSAKLIHLTKDGRNIPDNKDVPGKKGAFENFINITGLGEENNKDEGVLKGSNYGFAGEHACNDKRICFTETPISKLAYTLSNPNQNNMRYFPFGVMFEKAWIFQKGGRPVIYQPYNEFKFLPESHKYLHETLRLGDPSKKDIDYSWEREWRICADELPFTPGDAILILPNHESINHLITYYTSNMKRSVGVNIMVEENSTKAADEIKPFPWNYIVLEDLGFPIHYTFEV